MPRCTSHLQPIGVDRRLTAVTWGRSVLAVVSVLVLRGNLILGRALIERWPWFLAAYLPLSRVAMEWSGVEWLGKKPMTQGSCGQGSSLKISRWDILQIHWIGHSVAEVLVLVDRRSDRV